MRVETLRPPPTPKPKKKISGKRLMYNVRIGTRGWRDKKTTYELVPVVVHKGVSELDIKEIVRKEINEDDPSRIFFVDTVVFDKTVLVGL